MTCNKSVGVHVGLTVFFMLCHRSVIWRPHSGLHPSGHTVQSCHLPLQHPRPPRSRELRPCRCRKYQPVKGWTKLLVNWVVFHTAKWTRLFFRLLCNNTIDYSGEDVIRISLSAKQITVQIDSGLHVMSSVACCNVSEKQSFLLWGSESTV